MRSGKIVLSSMLALAMGGTGCLVDTGVESGASRAQDLPEGISAELVSAAIDKATIVAREIDRNTLSNYGIEDPTPADGVSDADRGYQFVQAVIREYGQHPDILRARLQAIASMVMFSAPEVQTDPDVGHVTAYHGMDDAAFEALMDNEGSVWDYLLGLNQGQKNGVRPFSVCETKFLIAISKDTNLSSGVFGWPPQARVDGDGIGLRLRERVDNGDYLHAPVLVSMSEGSVVEITGGPLGTCGPNAAESTCWLPVRAIDATGVVRDGVASADWLEPVYVTDRTLTRSGYELGDDDFAAYADGYRRFAESEAQCSRQDLTQWYNTRGLGHLRPTWVESNLMDRFQGRMLRECDGSPSAAFEADCAEYEADPLGYRQRKNSEMALRMAFYDPNATIDRLTSEWDPVTGQSQTSIAQVPMGAYIADTSAQGVLVEDRNGDGIGEWIAPGPGRFVAGARIRLGSGSKFPLPESVDVTLSAETTVRDDAYATSTLPAGAVITVLEGADLALTRSTTRRLDDASPIQINAGSTVEIGDGALVFHEGTRLTIQSSWVDGQYRQPTGRLAADVVLTPDSDRPAYTTIDKIDRGLLASNNFAYETRAHVPLVWPDTANVARQNPEIVGTVNAGDVVAYDAVDPSWDPAYLARPDLGLGAIFADGAGCTGPVPNPHTCPLLERFYTVIDRHESFYQIYSSVKPAASNVSQQPSPLVACSVTLAQANSPWTSAGVMPGGNAGFIFLMRIPFAQILSGDTRSISTLGVTGGDPAYDGVHALPHDAAVDERLYLGPRVLTVQDVYEYGATLDMGEVWLDIATLSNDLYAGENEVSKYGAVPADQIEGILVVRRPVALDAASPVDVLEPAPEDPHD